MGGVGGAGWRVCSSCMKGLEAAGGEGMWVGLVVGGMGWMPCRGVTDR